MKLVLPTDTDLISSFCFATKGAPCLDWPHESCWLVYKARGKQTRPRVLNDVKSYKPAGQARKELKCRRHPGISFKVQSWCGQGSIPWHPDDCTGVQCFPIRLTDNITHGEFPEIPTFTGKKPP